jgi:Uma2 family endonuclease
MEEVSSARTYAMAVPDVRDSEAAWPVPARLRLELLALLSTDPTHTATLNYDEFLEWADEDTLAEWVDGRVVMSSPANARHQYLVIFLQSILTAYTSVHDLGTILIAPFQMKLAQSGREPDVLFLSTQHLDRLRTSHILGPADLVIEVISKESRGRDRGDKFYEYREGSVPEYWLLDPETEQAEFYQLDAEGRYQLAAADADGIYHSAVVSGFWLRADWLWRQPLPDPVQVLLQVDRDAYLQYLQQQIEQANP